LILATRLNTISAWAGLTELQQHVHISITTTEPRHLNKQRRKNTE